MVPGRDPIRGREDARGAAAAPGVPQWLAEQGKVAIAGPLADGSGGVFLVEAADLDDLHAMIDQDPYYTEGVVAARTVRGFKPVLGSWLPQA